MFGIGSVLHGNARCVAVDGRQLARFEKENESQEPLHRVAKKDIPRAAGRTIDRSAIIVNSSEKKRFTQKILRCFGSSIHGPDDHLLLLSLNINNVVSFTKYCLAPASIA